MLLEKITNKLGFIIKKIPFKVVKPFLLSIMFFDDIFLKLRINLLNIFFSKNKISKALKELKNNGVAIIPNFYSEEQISKIKNNCIKQLDELPLAKLSNNEDISNMPVKIFNSVSFELSAAILFSCTELAVKSETKIIEAIFFIDKTYSLQLKK